MGNNQIEGKIQGETENILDSNRKQREEIQKPKGQVSNADS